VRSGEVAPVAPRPRAPGAASSPASFGVRLLSGIADALLLSLAQAVVLGPVLYYWSGRALPASATEALLPIALSLALLPLALVLGIGYYVYGWGVRGATLGQRSFGLAVVGEDGRRPIGMGRAGLRFLGYLLSAASLGVGFLMIAFTGSGLHDRIAGTRVVRGRST
jgi:uncharacterized RDD family membrane protein YckC